jgi:NADH dehydrogenase
VKRIVIVGGGFGGLYAAQALARADAQVTLVDRRNHHLFSPLLYQVATAGLSAPDIATPIRSILRHQRNTRSCLRTSRHRSGEPRGHDRPRAARLRRAHPRARLDARVLRHDDWAPNAPGLKDVEDAFEIRRRILLAFENAEQEPDESKRRAWLTFAIVGAGPTGVELAGALEEIAKRTLAKDFRNFDPASARVVLIDAAPRVLAPFSEHLSRLAHATLEKRGVEILLNRRVTGIDAAGVAMGDVRIEARTVLWAAGVASSPLGAQLARRWTVRAACWWSPT